jgi:hypothetical protein
MPWPSYPLCPVQHYLLGRLVQTVLAVLSQLPCSWGPVPPVLLLLPCYGCLVVLSMFFVVTFSPPYPLPLGCPDTPTYPD